jgi:hypothetical protein
MTHRALFTPGKCPRLLFLHHLVFLLNPVLTCSSRHVVTLPANHVESFKNIVMQKV